MNQTIDTQTSVDRCIYLHEEFEVGYWTTALGVDKAQLMKTVQEVGNGASAVKRALGIH